MGQQTSTVTKASDFDPTQARLTGADGGTPIDTEIVYGQDDHGTDLKVFGDTSSNYMLWDESVDSLLLVGTAARFSLGSFTGAAIGTGSIVSSSVTAPFKVFADDGGAAIGSGSLVRAGWFRNLQTYTSGNREQEACGVQGSLVSVAGTNRHNMCGVLGSYEGRTSLVVDGQASSTDPWIQAGVIGRVGMASGTLTVNQYGVLAGLAAMSNVNTACSETFTGRFAGLYVGRWASANSFEYAIYAEDVVHGYYITADLGAISGEEHGESLALTGTLSSGDSIVGKNIVVTTGGTAGTWASAIFAKVVQGTTKNVNGYICAAEFEVDLGSVSGTLSNHFVLVLNYNHDDADITSVSHHGYMQLHSYGDVDPRYFLNIQDFTIGTKADTSMVSTFADGAHISHSIKIQIGTTPYWILCSSTAPSGT